MGDKTIQARRDRNRISHPDGGGEKGTPNEDMDVYEFQSVAELKAFRKRWPEKMREQYAYLLSSGTDRHGHQVAVAVGEHFRQFMREVKRAGVQA